MNIHIRRMLTLIFLLLLLPAYTLAASCTACGKAVDAASSTFCPYCGAKITSPLEITQAHLTENSAVHFRWNDSQGNGPYKVYYSQLVHSNFHAFEQQHAMNWYAGETSSPSFTLTKLVPGEDYWLSVRDSKDHLAYYRYCAPFARRFEAIPCGINLQAVIKDNDRSYFTSAFTNDDVSLDGICHLSCWLTFPEIKSDYPCTLMLAITDPADTSICRAVYLDTALEARYGYWGWNALPLDPYFDQVKEMYGDVIEGEYCVTFFVNGQVAAWDCFYVE